VYFDAIALFKSSKSIHGSPCSLIVTSSRKSIPKDGSNSVLDSPRIEKLSNRFNQDESENSMNEGLYGYTARYRFLLSFGRFWSFIYVRNYIRELRKWLLRFLRLLNAQEEDLLPYCPSILQKRIYSKSRPRHQGPYLWSLSIFRISSNLTQWNSQKYVKSGWI